jgi:hypothetical protein
MQRDRCCVNTLLRHIETMGPASARCSGGTSAPRTPDEDLPVMRLQ